MADKSKDNIIQITAVREHVPKGKNDLFLMILFACVFLAELCGPAVAAAVNGCRSMGDASVIAASVAAVLVCASVMTIFKLFAEKSRMSVWLWAVIMAAAAAALILLMFRTAFKNGAVIYGNSILFNWNLKTGAVVYFRDFGEGNATAELVLFLAAASVLITLILEMLFYYSRKIEIIVLDFLFFAAAAALLPGAAAWPAVCSGLLMLLYIAYCGTDRHIFHERGRAKVIGITAAVCALAIFAAVAVTAVLPGDLLSSWQASVIRSLEDIRFGRGDLTDGSFARADSKSSSGSKRLSVRVEKDDDHMIYLRGFVGSVYTGSGWKDLEEKTYRGMNLAMLQWLSQNNEEDPGQDFIAISSSANALALANENARENGLQSYDLHSYSYEIRNTGASEKYMYVPAGLTSIDIDASRMNRDLNIKNSLFYQADYYQTDSMELDPDDYIYLIDNGSLTDSEYQARNEYFIIREQTYSDFVDEYYTDVPDQLAELFDRTSDTGRGNIEGASDIVWDVREYLENNMEYNEHPSSTYRTPKASSSDYILNLLENDHNGYCVQYASAATLLFRYLGMPARYVEGYLIDTARSLPDADGTYTVTEADAHAWVEIYRYGFGWVPVDVTPGCYNIPKERQLITKKNVEETGGEREEETKEGPDKEKQENEQHTRWWIFALIIIAAVLLFFVLRHLIAMKIRDRKIHGRDDTANIQAMAGLIVRNAALAGISLRRDLAPSEADRMNGFVKGYEDAAAAVAHAFYSESGADGKDAEIVEGLLNETVSTLYKSAGILRKLKLKYIYLV